MFARKKGQPPFEVRSDIWEMEKTATPLKVENIVVSVLLTGLPDTEKKQEQSKHSKFPHILHINFPFKDYSCKVYLYSGGKVNLVGIKCYEDIAICAIKSYEYIRKTFNRTAITIRKIAIHNIVASGYHESNLKLDLLEKMRMYAVGYQAHKFPGAYLREGNKKLKEPVTVFKLFRSGSVYTVGSHTHDSIVRNGERLPKYVDTVSYNHVCMRQLPPPYPIDEIQAIVNADPIFQRLCGRFDVASGNVSHRPYLKSRPFFYPGKWNVERLGPRFLFTAYITDSGGVYESAERVLTSTRQSGCSLTARKRIEMASTYASAQHGVFTEEDVQQAMEGYSKIELRPSTLIPGSAVSLLKWTLKINASSSICTRIGKASFCSQGVHYYVRTSKGVTMHADGDLNFPSSMNISHSEQSDIADKVWKVCGFISFERYVPKNAPSQEVQNMKKTAADLNRARVYCRYEPISNVIRMEAGALLDKQGAIWKPKEMHLNLPMIWGIAKVTKEPNKRRRLEVTESMT